MTWDNLMSGFIGSIIGVLAGQIINKINVTSNLNRSRKRLVIYLKMISGHHLPRYIKDCEAVIKLISDTTLKSGGSAHTFDTMPLLSSEYFRLMGDDTINRLCLVEQDFVTIMDIYHTIDYLKKDMPNDHFNGFVDWWWKHLDNYKVSKRQENKEAKKNVVAIGQYLNDQHHFESCPSVADKRRHFVEEVQLRANAANYIMQAANDFIKKYEDPERQWDVEYFSR